MNRNQAGETAIEGLNGLSKSCYTDHRAELIQAFKDVRGHTTALTASLSAEDMQLQSMPDASPGKWHLAHTSWFFEAFILARFKPGFNWHQPVYAHLFNSYYKVMGEPFPRPDRGMISRPGLAEIRQYRQAVDEQMLQLLGHCRTGEFRAIAPLLVLGINHEQQHQELILTDIKHALFQNPVCPAVSDEPGIEDALTDFQWLAVNGGEAGIGYDGDGFCFDNELPRHRVLLPDFEIANRLVSNAEWLEFVDDDAYQQPLLWLSDGWAWRSRHALNAPYYWQQKSGQWQEYTLAGLRPLKPDAPLTHISYYEADAYARWRACRLPTEFEWEHACHGTAVDGPEFVRGQRWEWTSSPYGPYPGFNPANGNVGEYNGKFMVNQMVLRGASGATSTGHSRASYRNFFYPDARWQFSGLRLARNPGSQC